MNIEFNNKKYILDTRRAIDTGVMVPVVHKIGNRYKCVSDKNEYILACTGEGFFALICLNDGNRWFDAVKLDIGIWTPLTEKQFDLVANNESHVFVLTSGPKSTE